MSNKIVMIKNTINKLKIDKKNCQKNIDMLNNKIENIDGTIKFLKDKYGDKLYEKK